jgi:polar amino acid transport system substrate-binding protein
MGAVAAAAAPGRPSSVRAASAIGQASAAACNPDASSLRPSGPPQVTSGPFMEKIRARGYLIAGVDQNTYHFGFLNPLNGQLEGFDIDMVRAVSQAIFGNPNQVHYKAISDAQREPDIQSGTVDIVAHTMTILCKRLKHEDFSSVYFDAAQRVLVLKNSPARSLADLRGQKVCATTGADSLAVIAKYGAIPVAVPYWTDCLVLLQQGDVAAISTDDAILFGLAAQDPFTMVVGPRLTDEPYGLAISNQHPDFVRFVNAVLEQMRTNGQWAASYARWIGRPVPAPPPALYAG